MLGGDHRDVLEDHRVKRAHNRDEVACPERRFAKVPKGEARSTAARTRHVDRAPEMRKLERCAAFGTGEPPPRAVDRHARRLVRRYMPARDGLQFLQPGISTRFELD